MPAGTGGERDSSCVSSGMLKAVSVISSAVLAQNGVRAFDGEHTPSLQHCGHLY